MSLPLHLRRSFVPGIMVLAVAGFVAGAVTLPPVVSLFLAGLGPDTELLLVSPRVVAGASSTWILLVCVGLVGPFASLQYLRHHLPMRRPGLVYLGALGAGAVAAFNAVRTRAAELADQLARGRGLPPGDVPVDLSLVPLLPAGLAFTAMAMAVVILAGIHAAYRAERSRYDL